MNKILVTGANGFVGCPFADALEKAGQRVVRAVRASPRPGQMAVGDIDPGTDWTAALQGCDAVVHLAARVHVMRDVAADPMAEFRSVNTAGTLNLARQSAQAGIRRFIYLSSIKVNGESTGALAYRESDPANPQDPYAVSKWEAELGLWTIASETGMEVVILRSPLVYGPGVKANFYRLIRWVDKGVPLPLALVNNRRSMIYRDNLVDALIACLQHPAAAGKTYLLSDGRDISTAELIHGIAQAMGKPDRLWSFPPSLLKLLGSLAGKSAEVERLLGDLRVDSSSIRLDLGWSPPYSMEQGLSETVKWYQTMQSAD